MAFGDDIGVVTPPPDREVDRCSVVPQRRKLAGPESVARHVALRLVAEVAPGPKAREQSEKLAPAFEVNCRASSDRPNPENGGGWAISPGLESEVRSDAAERQSAFGTAENGWRQERTHVENAIG